LVCWSCLESQYQEKYWHFFCHFEGYGPDFWLWGVIYGGIYVSDYSQTEKWRFHFLYCFDPLKSCVFIILKRFNFFFFWNSTFFFAIFHYRGNENELGHRTECFYTGFSSWIVCNWSQFLNPSIFQVMGAVIIKRDFLTLKSIFSLCNPFFGVMTHQNVHSDLVFHYT
jgi:hypothetical protein